MSKQPAITPFGLRIPTELKQWLDAHAKENGRSINSEIIQIIKASKDARGGLNGN